MLEWCVRAAVVQRVLDKLEAGNADGVETEMVGAAGVAQSDRGYADVLERLHPLFEDRADGGILLQVDSANFSAAVVDVEIAGDFFLLGLYLNRTGNFAHPLGKFESDRDRWSAESRRSVASRSLESRTGLALRRSRERRGWCGAA